jgi:hypothetical protein
MEKLTNFRCHTRFWETLLGCSTSKPSHAPTGTIQDTISIFAGGCLPEQLYYITQIFYVVVQSLAKFSILLLYLRIFLNKRFRLVTKIAIGWMTCHTIAFVIVVALQCLPVDSVWDTAVPGKCINSQAFVYSAAGCSILEDFVVMLLPIWELKGLNLDLRKRLALVFMFSLGSL